MLRHALALALVIIKVSVAKATDSSPNDKAPIETPADKRD